MTLRISCRSVNATDAANTTYVRAALWTGSVHEMERFDEQVKNAFAKALKKARENAGYASAAEFANAMSMTPAAYRYWERGGANPNLTQLTRICQLLKVEPNDLLPLALRERTAVRRSGDSSKAA